MNKYLTFKKNIGWAVGNEEKFHLLGLFITDQKYDVFNTITLLESVFNEEKAFNEVQNPNVIWDFGGAEGEFECDKDTAYFYSETDPKLNLEIPLSEVIEVLKEWKAFLEE